MNKYCVNIFEENNKKKCCKNWKFISGVIGIIGIGILFFVIYLHISKHNNEDFEISDKYSKINQNKSTIAQNEKKYIIQDCTKFLKIQNKTTVEILDDCVDKNNVQVCFNSYGNERLVEEEDRIFLTHIENKIPNVTKIECNHIVLCGRKELANEHIDCNNIRPHVKQIFRVEINNNNINSYNDTNDNNWIGEIVYKNLTYICDAIGISSNRFITAGTCLQNKESHNLFIKINVSNSFKPQYYEVNNFEIHPKMNRSTFNIAFLDTIKTIENKAINICNNFLNMNKKGIYYTNANCFDNQLTEQLQFESQSNFIKKNILFFHLLSDTTLIARNNNHNCLGNRGSPAVFKYDIFGTICLNGIMQTEVRGYKIFTKITEKIYQFVTKNIN